MQADMVETQPGPVKTRSKWPIRRVHKWMSVAIGVLVIMWSITGLVMITAVEPPEGVPLPPVDYATLAVTPAQAMQIALAARPNAAPQSINMRRIGERMVYAAWLSGAPPVLVDATSGAVVTITPELARAIAVEGLPGTPRIARFDLLETRPFGYYGGIPVYRADIDDGHETRAYVNPQTGEMQRNAKGNRLKGFIASFHEFTPLRALPAGSEIRQIALWVTSLITVAVGLTGYWMALPRRKRRDG